MIKIYFQLLILFFFSCSCFSQIDEAWSDSGLIVSDTSPSYIPMPKEEVLKYILSTQVNSDQSILGGYIISIYHEPLDKAKILIQIEGKPVDSTFSNNGLFRMAIPAIYDDKSIKLLVNHNDFNQFDTTFLYKSKDTVINFISLQPRIKILLRGRIYASSLPIEGVNVYIKHNDDEYKLTTMSCYTDKENYWNCLYLGMFKQELVADDSSDSIYLSFDKAGLKPLQCGMTFREYTGEIMYLKMRYTSRTLRDYSNNFSFKLSFPLINTQNNWYTSLSYYRLLKIANIRRLAIGMDASLLMSTVTVSLQTFPGLEETRFDSSYYSLFLGPSALVWLLNPNRRYFATYAGSTYAYNTLSDKFSIQPFIGTRVLLDFNKALSLEFRYLHYDLDVVHYNFIGYGNANRTIINKTYEDFMLNIGLQVLF